MFNDHFSLCSNAGLICYIWGMIVWVKDFLYLIHQLFTAWFIRESEINRRYYIIKKCSAANDNIWRRLLLKFYQKWVYPKGW